MINQLYSNGGLLGIGSWRMGISILMAILLVWSVVWKGLALWRAARTGSKGWFVALLLINTVGILEIIYLYAVNPKKSDSVS